MHRAGTYSGYVPATRVHNKYGIRGSMEGREAQQPCHQLDNKQSKACIVVVFSKHRMIVWKPQPSQGPSLRKSQCLRFPHRPHRETHCHPTRKMLPSFGSRQIKQLLGAYSCDPQRWLLFHRFQLDGLAYFYISELEVASIPEHPKERCKKHMGRRTITPRTKICLPW